MHPYSNKPAHSFWRKSVSETGWRDLELTADTKFRLRPEMRISTAGSCFAQHISRHMGLRGMAPFRTEVAHPLEIASGLDVSSYDAFSARYGNIYTSRQCLELLRQALGNMAMVEDFATHEGRVYDLLRPNILPLGFASEEEAVADRVYHLRKVREMFELADVFVFTLGLTESWYHAGKGYTYPVCPGTVRGTFDPELHQFRNLTHSEVAADLRALITSIAAINPTIKIILTVSPVPLVATYTREHVLVASMYSKSVLRGACGEVAAEFDHVQYFPSYEIISHVASFGQYLQGDLREVTERGVSHVMASFFFAFYGISDAIQHTERPAASALPQTVLKDISKLLEAECEEMFNDPK